MRLGVMQPYFFPYAGHFSLVAHTDQWVVFDTAQYRPKRWMNRNRVLSETGGWTWLTLSVQGVSRSAPVRDVQLEDLDGSRRKVLGRLRHYTRRAPFCDQVTDLVDGVLAGPGDGTLVDLDMRALSAVCSYLGLPFRARRLSQMGLDLPVVDHPGGWAPAISAALGADGYLNPIGGRALFDMADFDDAGVELLFCDAPDFRYDTGPYRFEPGLSILDALMWCSPQQVVDYLYGAAIVPARALDASRPECTLA